MSELYKDSSLNITLSDNPASVGHLVVKPNKQISNIEDFTDEEIEHLFFAASYSATALFELLGAQGTNMIFSDLDGAKIDIISRKENDGLNFIWNPSEVNQGELDDVAKTIKDGVDLILWQKDHPEEKKKEVSNEDSEIKEIEGEINYLLKSLDRTP